jgi:fumarylacetoacetase
LTNPAAEKKEPVLSPCRKLDIELELGCFVCKPNALGQPVGISEAPEHLFGVVLMNDWSARDIQAWEYVPLGPFNSKNFGTSISPWVVLMDALEPFKTTGLTNDTTLLPYLDEKDRPSHFAIDLSFSLTPPASGKPTMLCRTSATQLLFSFPQMLTHHTVGGCPFNVGDLLGSGTISGKGKEERGALLEQTEGGKHELQLEGGETRVFLEDGDTVILSGVCGSEDGALVGFGECVGTIEPALEIRT